MKEASSHCLLQNYPQQSRNGIDISAHLLMDLQGNCGAQTTVLFSLKKKKKKSVLVLFSATWMNFQGIILNEASHAQNDKYHMIPLSVGSSKVDLREVQSRIKVTRCWEGEQEGGIQGEADQQASNHS